MILEIGYTLTLDKNSKSDESWTYFFTKEEDLKKAIDDAGKYFKKFVKENGWTRKAKLKSIRVMAKQNDTYCS